MARNSVGSLVVSLGLDAVDFIDGLNKSEQRAKKFGESIGTGIKNAAGLAGAALASLGLSATGALVGFDQMIKAAGDFQDLAEKTGASAEALAGFSTAAAVGGTSIETVAAASQKLTKALVGVDDESKAAGAALAALGVPIEDFKKQDPAGQLETVSKALAEFKDGAGKTAVAMALFGKSGAEILPFLKALEEQGGRQVILTAEQIKQADDYADRQAKARSELQQYAQALSTQALPALTALTGALTEAAKEMLGVNDAGKLLANGGHVASFAEESAMFLATAIDYARNFADSILVIAKSYGAAGRIISAVARGQFGEIKDVLAEARKEADGLFNNNFAERVGRQFASIRKNTKLAAQEMRGFNPNGRELNFGGAVGAGKTGKAAAERKSDADKYLENLQKQLEKTQDLTVVEQVLADLQKNRLGAVSGAALADILLVGQQIDAARAFEKAQKESNDLLIESNKEVQRSREDLVKQGAALTESLRTPLEVLQAGQAEANRLLDAGVVSAETFRRAMVKVSEDYQRAFEDSKKAASTFDTFANRAAENVQDQLGSGLKSILDGNFKDIGKNFTGMINGMVAEAVAADLARNLFGDLLKGGKGEGLFGQALKGLFGGGGGTSGSNPSAFTSSTGGGFLDNLFGGFKGLFSGFFADGGYIPPGQWGMTGERGPEPVFGGRTGVTVQPNGGGGGRSVVIQQSFAPGSTRQTFTQAATEMARVLQRGQRNL